MPDEQLEAERFNGKINYDSDEPSLMQLKFEKDGSQFRYELLKIVAGFSHKQCGAYEAIKEAEKLKNWINNSQ